MKIQLSSIPLAFDVTSDAILDLTFDVTFHVTFEFTFIYYCHQVSGVRCQVPFSSWLNQFDKV